MRHNDAWNHINWIDRMAAVTSLTISWSCLFFKSIPVARTLPAHVLTVFAELYTYDLSCSVPISSNGYWEEVKSQESEPQCGRKFWQALHLVLGSYGNRYKYYEYRLLHAGVRRQRLQTFVQTDENPHPPPSCRTTACTSATGKPRASPSNIARLETRTVDAS